MIKLKHTKLEPLFKIVLNRNFVMLYNYNYVHRQVNKLIIDKFYQINFHEVVDLHFDVDNEGLLNTFSCFNPLLFLVTIYICHYMFSVYIFHDYTSETFHTIKCQVKVFQNYCSTTTEQIAYSLLFSFTFITYYGVRSTLNYIFARQITFPLQEILVIYPSIFKTYRS